MFFCRELRTRLLSDTGKPRRTGHVVFTFTSVTWALSTTLWRFPGEFSHLRTFSTVFKPRTPSSPPPPSRRPQPSASGLPRGTHRWPLRSPHFPFSSVPEEEPFVPLNLRSSFSSGIIVSSSLLRLLAHSTAFQRLLAQPHQHITKLQPLQSERQKKKSSFHPHPSLSTQLDFLKLPVVYTTLAAFTKTTYAEGK